MKKDLKILIAEDDPANANLLDLLKKKGGGYHATIVGNGVEALKFPNEISLDTLLTDWMMPEINGI